MEAKNTIKKVGSWVSFVVGIQSFIKQIWKYLALIFAGVIAGLVYGMKQIKPVQNISTDQFINDQNRELNVGKIKQKGEGNTMDLHQLTGKEKRQARRAKRRERKSQEEKEELESKDTGA